VHVKSRLYNEFTSGIKLDSAAPCGACQKPTRSAAGRLLCPTCGLTVHTSCRVAAGLERQQGGTWLCTACATDSQLWDGA
jgi:hypothetical protein